MAYRDDLAAAHARAAAAERRAAGLELELARVVRAEALVAAGEPSLPTPIGYELTRTDGAVTIQWRWWNPTKHGVLLLFALVWNIGMISWYSGSLTLFSALFPILHLAFGLGITYYALAGVFNRTVVRVMPEGVSINHGPLPWPGSTVLARCDVAQIYARRVDITRKRSVETSWSLHVHQRSGQDRKLLPGLETHTHALFLERELERALGIRDRPVEGEA